MRSSLLSTSIMSLLVLMQFGCSTRIGNFSFISTGTPQYNKMSNAPVKQRIQGTDSRIWLLFFPLGGAPSLEEAVDSCMDKGGGDFIERVRLYETWWTVGLISGTGFKVIGDVGNSKAGNSGQP